MRYKASSKVAFIGLSTTNKRLARVSRSAEIELLDNGAAEIITGSGSGSGSGSGRRVPVSRRHLREMKDRLLIP